MKTYNISVNTSAKFQSSNYLKVGTVRANSIKEAKRKAEDERKGKSSGDVEFTMNMDNDSRSLIIQLA